VSRPTCQHYLSLGIFGFHSRFTTVLGLVGVHAVSTFGIHFYFSSRQRRVTILLGIFGVVWERGAKHLEVSVVPVYRIVAGMSRLSKVVLG
jgi:hypothetical protein